MDHLVVFKMMIRSVILMFERIDTICLTVSDVERSSSWYQEVLGLKEVFKGEGYRILKVGSGQIPLTIEEGSTSSNENNTYPIFFTKEIEKTYKKLKEQGVDVAELINDGENHFFDFFDLDNNKLQVCYWQ